MSGENEQPTSRPWVALTASDLTDLAEELNRLNYTTNARAGVTCTRHDDDRLIEYRRLPGSSDLVVMVIGHLAADDDPAPASPSPQESPE